MIPIIWRYLLVEYFKTAAFCLLAFIAVLLTTRLGEIAHFASLGAPISLVMLFIANQIPYILPITIPIACLISAVLLVQKLGQTHEITAMRSVGMAMRDFLTPLLLASVLISIANFYIVSELATSSHLANGTWKSELRSVNPLLLLKNKHLMKTKGGYFQTLGSSSAGQVAKQVVFAMPGQKGGRISLLLSDELKIEDNQLICKNISQVMSFSQNPSKQGLLVENIASLTTSSNDFSHFFERGTSKINNDHLKLSLLLSRLKTEKTKSCITEITRRFSIAISPISFTLLGLAFGVRVGRFGSSRKVITMILLSFGYLFAYFFAKGVEENLKIAITCYLVPHLVILAASFRSLKRISRGQEV